MTRMFLRPGVYFFFIATIAVGRIVFPLLHEVEPVAQAYVPATMPCEAESNAVNAATQTLIALELDLAEANTDLAIAGQALNHCENTTPGMCQSEQDDVNVLQQLVQALEQDVAQAGVSVQEAQYAYQECLYGNP